LSLRLLGHGAKVEYNRQQAGTVTPCRPAVFLYNACGTITYMARCCVLCFTTTATAAPPSKKVKQKKTARAIARAVCALKLPVFKGARQPVQHVAALAPLLRITVHRIK
jgi:hypothetical protein